MKKHTRLWAHLNVFILSMFLARPLLSEEVRVGDSVARVIELLGEPRGRLSNGALEIISYDRGTVTLVGGEVTAHTLVSPEEVQRKREAYLKREAEQRAAVAAARRRRIEEGTAERADKLKDTAFTNQVTELQLKYWLAFQKKYPEVSVADEIEPLREVLRKEAYEKEMAERKALARQIKETEAAIEKLANRSGVGRTAFVKGNRELARLRKELDELHQRQAALDGKRGGRLSK